MVSAVILVMFQLLLAIIYCLEVNKNPMQIVTCSSRPIIYLQHNYVTFCTKYGNFNPQITSTCKENEERLAKITCKTEFEGIKGREWQGRDERIE